MDNQLDKKQIQEHVDKGNYHAAINIAISAMNECRRNNEQDGVDAFIKTIRDIVNTMDDEYGSKA